MNPCTIFTNCQSVTYVKNKNPCAKYGTTPWHRAAKGTFYLESAGEMWNRHMEVPKIALELLFL